MKSIFQTWNRQPFWRCWSKCCFQLILSELHQFNVSSLPPLKKRTFSVFIFIPLSAFHAESLYINSDILWVPHLLHFTSCSTRGIKFSSPVRFLWAGISISRKATTLNSSSPFSIKLTEPFSSHRQVHLLWWDWPECRHGLGYSLRSQEVHCPSPGARLRHLPGDQPERQERLCLTLPELSVRGAGADAALLGGDWCPGWAGATLRGLLRHRRPDPGEHPTARNTQH